MKLKNRKIAILVLAAVFAVLLAVYFIWVQPLVKELIDDSVKLDLMDGEIPITNKLTTFYIREPVGRDQIRSVHVTNEFGEYTVSRENAAASQVTEGSTNVKLGDFLLNGYKGLPFDDNQLASLIVTAGTPIAMMRVARDLGGEREKLAEYGLDEPQASWTVTCLDGSTYTFYVGDELITEGGYYVMLDGRDAVYISSLTLADTILKPAHALLAPKIIEGLTDSNYYYLESLSVFKHDEPYIATKLSVHADQTISFNLIYPRPENNTSESFYEINENFYLEVLYSFVNLQGESVVAMLPTEDVYASYDLLDPEYTVMLTSRNAELVIMVSEIQPDGYRYATSSMYGFATIVKVPASTFAWLTYNQFSWISTMPFYVDITSVAKLNVKGYGDNTTDVAFTLKHGKDENNNNTLEVTEENSGKHFANDDVANFRKYYLTLMNITNQEYASLSDEDKASLTDNDDNLVMTMTYENTAGKVFEYRFYRYYESSTGHLSGGKLFVTVNGVGEFYTMNDLVEKALSDAQRVLNGLDVDSYGHN